MLFAPPDGLSASLFDFLWAWDRQLNADETFRVIVRPDAADATPALQVYTRETQVRLTAAHLAAGTYAWEVTVVSAHDATAGIEGEPVSEASDARTFTMTRPSTVATLVATPSQGDSP